MFEALQQRVCRANLDLVAHGLVTLTWGNVSELAPDRRHFAIKPSGVPYDGMEPGQMVVCDLDGTPVFGDLKPSSDTATHAMLYRELLTPANGFPAAAGIVHTHSTHATAFAQAREPIPCLGTTHADHFAGPVPVTRPLTRSEIDEHYEKHSGAVIVSCFRQMRSLPSEIPAVLLAGHAPLVWGDSAAKAVENAVALEAVARLALLTRQVNASAPSLEPHVLAKHHQRKHGPRAYYGQ